MAPTTSCPQRPASVTSGVVGPAPSFFLQVLATASYPIVFGDWHIQISGTSSGGKHPCRYRQHGSAIAGLIVVNYFQVVHATTSSYPIRRRQVQSRSLYLFRSSGFPRGRSPHRLRKGQAGRSGATEHQALEIRLPRALWPKRSRPRARWPGDNLRPLPNPGVTGGMDRRGGHTLKFTRWGPC
jgi:hypothetical protein